MGNFAFRLFEFFLCWFAFWLVVPMIPLEMTFFPYLFSLVYYQDYRLLTTTSVLKHVSPACVRCPPTFTSSIENHSLSPLI